MVAKGEERTEKNTVVTRQPRSLAVAEGGIQTGADFARLMSAMMSDVITGTLAPDVANAACNAGGKLLKVVEMQYKYVPPRTTSGSTPVLMLAPGESAETEDPGMDPV